MYRMNGTTPNTIPYVNPLHPIIDPYLYRHTGVLTEYHRYRRANLYRGYGVLTLTEWILCGSTYLTDEQTALLDRL